MPTPGRASSRWAVTPTQCSRCVSCRPQRGHGSAQARTIAPFRCGTCQSWSARQTQSEACPAPVPLRPQPNKARTPMTMKRVVSAAGPRLRRPSTFSRTTRISCMGFAWCPPAGRTGPASWCLGQRTSRYACGMPAGSACAYSTTARTCCGFRRTAERCLRPRARARIPMSAPWWLGTCRIRARSSGRSSLECSKSPSLGFS
mmetsp:Transcript_21255/g.67693  ORF Transcript_21255/g.67693 Transcript_21255/m.67693 type:complete len:202 (+) Transcript_21255:717-1322(+)